MSTAANTLTLLFMENNTIDEIGNTFNNVNGTPFNSTYKAQGLYSAGGFGTTNKAIQSNAAIATGVETVEFYYRQNTGATTTNRWACELYNGTYPFIVQRDPSGLRFVTNPGTWSGFASLSYDTWTHFGFTMDGTNVKMYKDNIFVAQTTANPNMANCVQTIGNRTGSGTGACDGFIDEWRTSSVVRTTFPTVDPTVGGQKRMMCGFSTAKLKGGNF